jgi:SAM-dependent methyltransferase
MAPNGAPLPTNLRVVSSLEENHGGFRLDGNAAAELQAAEDGHFWHRSRNLIILEELHRVGVSPGARILELGCGSGAVTAALSSRGYELTGIDGHIDLLRCAALRAPNAAFFAHDLSQGLGPVKSQTFDSVAFFDVIEHLDDPAEALRTASEVLTPGGLIVGTVPAQMSLWSASDIDDGHRIRYDESSLRHVLQQAGLKTRSVRPFHKSLFPLLFAQRKLLRRGARGEKGSRVVVPSAVVNRGLYALCRGERLVERLVWWPGTSLFFAAVRA